LIHKKQIYRIFEFVVCQGKIIYVGKNKNAHFSSDIKLKKVLITERHFDFSTIKMIIRLNERFLAYELRQMGYNYVTE